MHFRRQRRLSLVRAALCACAAIAGPACAGARPADFQAQQRGKMSQIEEDIELIVGGHFTPDAFGPEVYNAVIGRVKASSGKYLDAFESLFLSRNFDPVAQSELYLPTFLRLASAGSPERVKEDAGRLLKLYTAVLVVYDNAPDKEALFKLLPEEAVRLVQRLDTRRKELRPLAAR
jgi:hypothetical protein